MTPRGDPPPARQATLRPAAQGVAFADARASRRPTGRRRTTSFSYFPQTVDCQKASGPNATRPACAWTQAGRVEPLPVGRAAHLTSVAPRSVPCVHLCPAVGQPIARERRNRSSHRRPLHAAFDARAANRGRVPARAAPVRTGGGESRARVVGMGEAMSHRRFVSSRVASPITSGKTKSRRRCPPPDGAGGAALRRATRECAGVVVSGAHRDATPRAPSL